MTTVNPTVAEHIVSLVEAIKNCDKSGNREWKVKHDRRLAEIVRAYLPDGSGFDSGTTVDCDACTTTKLVFTTSYHHMNDNGFYDEWTDHKVTVKPGFGDIIITISGKNRNDIKDYIYVCFYHALNTRVSVDHVDNLYTAQG